MIDAVDNGYSEFRAMIYGGNPGRYWIDILTRAHGWAIDYFKCRDHSVIFKLTLIKSPHFCAVNRGCALGQRLSMDSAVTEFLGVEKKCTYFQDTDFAKLHFDSGDFNPMLQFFHEWTPEDRVTTKLSDITLSKFLTTYLSNWNGEIVKYVNSIGNQIISTYDITIQQLASYYGHTGGKGNLGKKKTEEHRANISAGQLGKKRTEDQRVQDVKWRDNLASAKTFIDTEDRMPHVRAGDVEEKRLGNWIANNKNKEKGTNSEREQLMKSEIPLAFEYNDRQVRDVKWRDYLASAKTFIDTENRIPNTRAGDVEEKRLGIWIVNNKRNEKGTNSEREQLMKSEIPIAFACVGESS
jgi:hypothetical protein